MLEHEPDTRRIFRRYGPHSMSFQESLMRFAPAGVALSLALALTSSMSLSAPPQPMDPRATVLLNQGRQALMKDDVEGAIDAYEAALAVDPGAAQVTLALAEATRREGLQGKALHYYREALERDPRNFAAISGEGQALLEKGAIEKAKRNLARLENVCGRDCTETRDLAAALARGPVERVVTAEGAKPAPVATN